MHARLQHAGGHAGRSSGRLRARSSVAAAAVKNAKRLAAQGQRLVKEPLFVPLQPDGSDAWRLEPVVQLLRDGAVGIVPTDSLPAVVCDVENRAAALKLFGAMELSPKKQLSVLVGSMADISHYTTGFPVPTQPGQPAFFRIAQRLLPGPFTFILPASKNLPSQVVSFKSGKAKHRKSVGVRMPDEPVTRALLEAFGGCLLSHSVHVPESLGEGVEVPDPGTLLDLYANRGLDFIVDVGPRTVTATTVVDLTSGEPEVLRVGKGDVSAFAA